MGQRGGENKGQDEGKRLEENQTEQMCTNGSVRSESEDDEPKLPESIFCDSRNTLCF